MRILSTGLIAWWGIAFSAFAWAFAPGEDVEVVIRSSWNTMCLEVAAASHANGARIYTAPCDDVPHQRWLIKYMGEGHYLVRAKHSLKCFDGSAVHDGAAIHQWDKHEGFNQRWRFERQDTGAYRIRMHTVPKCATLADYLALQPCQESPQQDWFIETVQHE
jgi:hypothetical protein